MRPALLALALLPALAACRTEAQTAAPPSSHPQKILTPEQLAFQQNLKTYSAQMDRLRAIANAVFAAEMAREKAPECPNASNTVAENECLAHENDLTTANLKTFTNAVRQILALPYPSQPGVPENPDGLTGHPGTPATNTAAFDTAESAWHTYAEKQCDAVDTLWRGGTIVNAVDLECFLRQARNHLRELDTVYSDELRPH